MDIRTLVGKTCVIGLSYFDEKGEVLKRSQLCGQVLDAEAETGIVIALNPTNSHEAASGKGEPAHFNLPPNLAPWFSAPAGRYRDSASGAQIDDPDFLVAWDVHRKTAAKAEGEHQWWEWLPRTAKPKVGQNQTA